MIRQLLKGIAHCFTVVSVCAVSQHHQDICIDSNDFTDRKVCNHYQWTADDSYDLSIGKGNFSAGSHDISATSTRTTVYREVRRESAPTDSGTIGRQLGIDRYRRYGSSAKTHDYEFAYIGLHNHPQPDALAIKRSLASMTVNKGTHNPQLSRGDRSANLDIGTGSDKRIYTTPYNNNYDFGSLP